MLCCGQVGIRIVDLDFKEMADPINLLEVDFYTSTMKDVYPKNSFLPRCESKPSSCRFDSMRWRGAVAETNQNAKRDEFD